MQQIPVGAPSPLHVLGALISVKLSNGETIMGEVFCYETNGSNSVVLKEQVDKDHASFRIIKLHAVREVTALNPPPATLDCNFPSCGKHHLEERERASWNLFQLKRHTIGINVTQDAQDIFDFIHKTHPDCCWIDGSRIRVMGVTVNPPYGPENCEGKGRALERIQQVLERFIQRKKSLKKKSSSSPVWSYPPHQQDISAPHVVGMSQHVFSPQPVAISTPLCNDEQLTAAAGITYATGPGGQPLMFLGHNPVPSPIGDSGNLMMLQQPNVGNGVMVMVVHGTEDNLISGTPGNHPILSNTSGTKIPGRQYYTPVIFANPTGVPPVLGQMTNSQCIQPPNTNEVGTPVILPIHTTSPSLSQTDTNGRLSNDPRRSMSGGGVSVCLAAPFQPNQDINPTGNNGIIQTQRSGINENLRIISPTIQQDHLGQTCNMNCIVNGTAYQQTVQGIPTVIPMSPTAMSSPNQIISHHILPTQQQTHQRGTNTVTSTGSTGSSISTCMIPPLSPSLGQRSPNHCQTVPCNTMYAHPSHSQRVISNGPEAPSVQSTTRWTSTPSISSQIPIPNSVSSSSNILTGQGNKTSGRTAISSTTGVDDVNDFRTLDSAAASTSSNSTGPNVSRMNSNLIEPGTQPSGILSHSLGNTHNQRGPSGGKGNRTQRNRGGRRRD